MQHAKDTFYVMLRDRLTALNPARTIALRGVIRPSLLVEENELSSATQATDTFYMRWSALETDDQGLIAMECELHYGTEGNTGNGGMDRGRSHTAMDAELIAALNTAPQNIPKRAFDEDATGIATGTRIFWTNARFASATTDNGRQNRTATVQIFAYQGAGE